MLRSRFPWLVVLLVAGWPSLSAAAPFGRAWAPAESLVESDGDRSFSPSLDRTLDGRPRLLVSAAKPNQGGYDGYRYDWTTTSWGPRRHLGLRSGHAVLPDAPPDRSPVLFVGGLAESHKIFWAEDVPGSTPTPEHIATTYSSYESNFAGAQRGDRRWVVLADNSVVRLFLSEGPGGWRELPDPGAHATAGVSAVALDDSTALVAWDRLFFGQALGWGTIRAGQWSVSPEPIPLAFHYSHPQLAPIPSGGAWLQYATPRSTGVLRRFEGGAFGPERELDCKYTSDPEAISVVWGALERGGGERPVVAWSFRDVWTTTYGICVCMAEGEDWALGDEIMRSRRGGNFAALTVTRDRNDDAWVAWREFYDEPVQWAHTFTTARASEPVVTVTAGRPELEWSLSELAPGTWWAVLRQGEGGAFFEVARLQAGNELRMSWSDEGARPGTLLRDGVSYRIRRESVDTRYEHLGPIGSWQPGHMRPRLAIKPQGPGSEALLLELSGTSSPRIELAIYDVSGRAIARREITLQGSGATQRFPLTFAGQPLGAGIYFARVRDASGAVSDGVRFVRLR
jgi:hypothetical protein